MWQVRPERPEDSNAIEALVIATFGAGRFAKTAYRLREGVAPVKELSFVATAQADGKLLGSIRFWPVTIGEQPALLLGPLAVRPDLRGKGIGISLMQKGLETARALSFGCVILVGDEPYYAKVGFARVPPGRLRLSAPVDPNRLLGLSLKSGALIDLKGEVRRAKVDLPVSAQATPLA